MHKILYSTEKWMWSNNGIYDDNKQQLEKNSILKHPSELLYRKLNHFIYSMRWRGREKKMKRKIKRTDE